jgi:hypothetical protein
MARALSNHFGMKVRFEGVKSGEPRAIIEIASWRMKLILLGALFRVRISPWWLWPYFVARVLPSIWRGP